MRIQEKAQGFLQKLDELDEENNVIHMTRLSKLESEKMNLEAKILELEKEKVETKKEIAKIEKENLRKSTDKKEL